MKSPKESKLINGNRPGSGGRREGAGRPPDWLKAKCSELFEKKQISEYVARVAAGEEVGAEHRDRLKASEMLKGWGFGKDDQPISGSLRIGLGKLIEDAQKERGLSE